MKNKSKQGGSSVRQTRGRGQRGYMVLTTTAAAFSMLGMAGLVIDLGRMYIAKDEAQTYADSVALYAANKLDGTSAGITAAQNTAAANTNKWNFGKSTLPAPTMEFAKPLSSNGNVADSSTWTTAPPNPPTNYAFVRVTAAVDVPLLFMRALTATTTSRAIFAGRR